MNLWQQVQAAAQMGRSLPWVILIFLVASVILFVLKPLERPRIRTAFLLFVLALVGLLVETILLSFGYGQSDVAYKWVRWSWRLFLAFSFVNVAGAFVFEIFLAALRLRPPRILRDLLLAVAYIVVGISVLSRDVDLTGIIATSAVLTAVIGLSFQDTLGNMMGGLALQMEHAIAVGDWIRIDNQEGLVKEVRWRHTTIETRNWDTVAIPNSVLMKSQVTILGRRTGQPRQHRQWVYFNVDFRYPPGTVIEAVETALRAEPIANVASDPSPNCVLMDFKESFCSYAVRYWLTDLAVDDPTNSVVRTRIYLALRRAEIPLALPYHSVYLTETEARARQRHSEEIQKRVAALSRVELFHSLTGEETHALAERLRVAPFAAGEAVTRQGAQAHWLYILTRGDVEVRLAADGELREHVATLHQGDFFGEMGMMTGEPRSATVIALSDVECFRLDKDAFQDIVHQRPEIAEDISHVLAQRKVELDAIREDLSEEARQARLNQHQSDVLRRIRSFFKLA